ncbi:MAG: hypothetical protein SH856_06720 [Flavobacteriales bacterium]|nr:hypothetical protein [Flavobacteriales bacterium]
MNKLTRFSIFILFGILLVGCTDAVEEYRLTFIVNDKVIGEGQYPLEFKTLVVHPDGKYFNCTAHTFSTSEIAMELYGNKPYQVETGFTTRDTDADLGKASARNNLLETEWFTKTNVADEILDYTPDSIANLDFDDYLKSLRRDGYVFIYAPESITDSLFGFPVSRKIEDLRKMIDEAQCAELKPEVMVVYKPKIESPVSQPKVESTISQPKVNSPSEPIAPAEAKKIPVPGQEVKPPPMVEAKTPCNSKKAIDLEMTYDETTGIVKWKTHECVDNVEIELVKTSGICPSLSKAFAAADVGAYSVSVEEGTSATSTCLYRLTLVAYGADGEQFQLINNELENKKVVFSRY